MILMTANSNRFDHYPIKQLFFGIMIIVETLSLAFATPVHASQFRVVDDNDTVVLKKNVHPLARPEFDRGATDASLPMERMILSLRLAPKKSADLENFLAELHDHASPDFHRWVTPEEFRERFGPSSDDISAVTGWLTSHGFSIDEVARGGTWINFSGTPALIERAFHTRIHDYYVNGKLHHANAQDPSIPRAFSDLVAGIVTLHDFPRKMMNNGIRIVPLPGSLPDFTSGSTHYLAPGDFATIYNVNALYNAGIDGSGQSIAIVGRTHPSSANWSTFRNMMGLSANPPQVIVNGTDPGDLGANEDTEADLDVEWSGAVARNATIKFVISKSTNTTDGVDLSAQYIVSNNLAPVMSTSFGSCETDLGTSENTFYNNLWQTGRYPGHHLLCLLRRRRRRRLQCRQRHQRLRPGGQRPGLHALQRGGGRDPVQRRLPAPIGTRATAPDTPLPSAISPKRPGTRAPGPAAPACGPRAAAYRPYTPSLPGRHLRGSPPTASAISPMFPSPPPVTTPTWSRPRGRSMLSAAHRRPHLPLPA